MDPEANMKRQIDLAREINQLYDRYDGEENSVLPESIAWRADELASLVLALAEWKKKGGAA